MTIVVFTVLLIVLAVAAGAGLAIFALIVLAGLMLPLIILAAIHRDEVPVEKLTRRLHH